MSTSYRKARGPQGARVNLSRFVRERAEEAADAMGFGWITLRRAGRTTPAVRIEAWDGQVAGPVGPAVLRWSEATDVEGDVLDHPWVTAPDLVQHTWGAPGAEDPAVITVRLQEGLRRERRVDTVTAGLLSASDGDLTAGQVVGAIATLLDLDPETLKAERRAEVADLVAEGFLVASRR